MPKAIFIGIDGGGTKTKIRLEDEQGQLIGETRSGPAQIRVSVDQAWQSIHQGLTKLLHNKGISLKDKHYHFYAGLALAGTEFKEPYRAFLSRPHPFTKLILKSDAYAACLGAHGCQDGAIIIIGTGVKGLQIENHRCIEVGGWGFPQGDEGSGAWLGLQAIRLTLHSVDGRLPSSLLSSAILAKFNNNLPALLRWSDHATSTQYATLAPVVIDCVDKQDHTALRIVKEAAMAIDAIGNALNANTINKDQPLPCSLFGGLAPFIAPWLAPPLRNRLTKRQYDASKGAIFMIKKHMGL